ncbi:MAG TPA: GntR family transcriptional regulator [Fibrobacteria bacterium]|nr:GntR family transcriptional regulator [Fibrobacteria bacterium]
MVISTRNQVLERLRKLSDRLPCQRLPPLRSLAASWGVSLATVQVAVADAVREGWLSTRRGSGVWAGAVPFPEAGPVDRMDAHRLAEVIARQIHEGKFAQEHPLPAPKDWAKLHGLHPVTVRKALGMLLAKGLVERRGRSWWLGRPLARRPHRNPVLLCIGAAETPGRMRIDSDREWDFWRELQSEAIRSGLSPRLIPWAGALPEPDESVFGAVVSTWHLPENPEVLDTLQRLKLPTAVWVAAEDSLPGARFRQARGMWFHDLAHGRGAGETMGAYLAGLGHRKVAWISPFHTSSWAQNRMAGLWASLGPEVERIEAFGSWLSEWDVQVQVAEDPAVLARMDLSGLDASGPYEALRLPLAEQITRDLIMDQFTPALETALASGATVWVAASDLVARWCLHWLAARGIHPPADLALASFDDTRESSRRNLTSLRFDVQGMVRSMIRQILSSRERHPQVSRYAGHVVERGTTASLP